MFTVTPLVSDVPGAAATLDPHLVNAWGLARSATSPWWVADNGTDESTLYPVVGTNLGTNSLVVDVAGGPTGVVFAGIADNFPVATDTDPTLGRASFVFDSEDGQVRAWRGGSSAFVTARGGAGAIYKGLAIAVPSPGQPLLYAADFHNARVDVFNGACKRHPAGLVRRPDASRRLRAVRDPDDRDTHLRLVRKQDEDAEDEIAGQGRGFVDAYDLAGNLLTRVAQHGQLDAPWGLALAPDTFGRYAGDLLVGNFGNGEINAYAETPAGFEHRGTLRSSDGQKLAIDGLWALEFGNAGMNGTPDTLFFTAGPNDESHGLFGTITGG